MVPLGSIRCRPTRTATLAPLHGGGRQHRSSRLAEPIDDRTEKGIDVVGYQEDRSNRSVSELEEVQTEMDDDRYAHSNPQVNSAAPTRQSVGQRQRLVRWIRVRCLGLHITESAGMGP